MSTTQPTSTAAAAVRRLLDEVHYRVQAADDHLDDDQERAHDDLTAATALLEACCTLTNPGPV